jgi:hypothetical protein
VCLKQLFETMQLVIQPSLIIVDIRKRAKLDAGHDHDLRPTYFCDFDGNRVQVGVDPPESLGGVVADRFVFRASF